MKARPDIPLEVRWIGRIDYGAALALQEETAAQRLSGQKGDTILLLEHDPVYTIGRTPDRSSLGPRTAMLPHPVVEISRGGQATYHGPGQLVGYLILDLSAYGRDLHRYLRVLEAALIDACAALGVPALRREETTGVWVGDRKLASIGVGVRQWICRHGFALNVTRQSIDGFRHIVPCGLSGVSMTCLADEGATVSTVTDLIAPVEASLRQSLATLRQC